MEPVCEVENDGVDLLSFLNSKFDRNQYLRHREVIDYTTYMRLVEKNPLLARTAHQRLYDMIASRGFVKRKIFGETVKDYNFFHDDENPIVGNPKTTEQLVNGFRAAANNYGMEKRILLLIGPVGSAKSTLVTLLKRGLENYSATEEGVLYTFSWKDIPSDLSEYPDADCPMHEDPLNLVLPEMRKELESKLNAIFTEQFHRNKDKDADKEQPYKLSVKGNLCPHCKFYMEQLMDKHGGDWEYVVRNHIAVHRLILSEPERRGIGTFQPKDEKNQDSTELTGDINYRKIGELGKDSDPRAFNFDGEFNIANRGLIEFIEILKLDVAFLYDLLGAAQEKCVKPKKFAQTSIDEVIIGHTNIPEFKALQANIKMEAFKDRTIKIPVPYLLRISDELQVLTNNYGADKVPQHIAPHTLYIAALWAVLTRLKNSKGVKVSPVEKAKLYDGTVLAGWNTDKVKELQSEHVEEGMTGMSCRFTQNCIAAPLVKHVKYINPFMVLNEISERLNDSALINDETEREYYQTCVGLAREELDEILKKEVQEAMVADGQLMTRLFGKYLDNICAHVEGIKIKDEYTGKDKEPDEAFMRSIEEKIEVSENAAHDFRTMIHGAIATFHRKKEEFKWDSNPKLAEALRMKSFEDNKDSIQIHKWTMGAEVADKETQAKIDVVKQRLIDNYGYTEDSAQDVLNYVGSIFARGDLAKSA